MGATPLKLPSTGLPAGERDAHIHLARLLLEAVLHTSDPTRKLRQSACYVSLSISDATKYTMPTATAASIAKNNSATVDSAWVKNQGCEHEYQWEIC